MVERFIKYLKNVQRKEMLVTLQTSSFLFCYIKKKVGIIDKNVLTFINKKEYNEYNSSGYLISTIIKM